MPASRRSARSFPGISPTICSDPDQEADPPGLRAGKLYQYVLENKTALIAEDNLLAGTTSTKAIGVMLYPDLYPLSLWPELETMATRKKNPFAISQEDIDILNFEVFPFWLDRTVMEVTRKDHDNPQCHAAHGAAGLLPGEQGRNHLPHHPQLQGGGGKRAGGPQGGGPESWRPPAPTQSSKTFIRASN